MASCFFLAGCFLICICLIFSLLCHNDPDTPIGYDLHVRHFGFILKGYVVFCVTVIQDLSKPIDFKTFSLSKGLGCFMFTISLFFGTFSIIVN